MRVVNGSCRRSFATATDATTAVAFALTVAVAGSRLLAGSGYLHHHVRTVRILRGLYLLRNIAMLSLHYRGPGHDDRMPSLRRLHCLRRYRRSFATAAHTTTAIAFAVTVAVAVTRTSGWRVRRKQRPRRWLCLHKRRQLPE